MGGSYLGNEPQQDAVINKHEYTATAGQVIFGVVFEDLAEVYQNGMLLASSDYTMDESGLYITLVTPASAGDLIFCVGYESYRYDITVTPEDLAAKFDKSGGQLTGAVIALRETKVDLGASSNIDLSSGNEFHKTITGSTTFTHTNALPSPAINSITLRLVNAGANPIFWSSFGTMRWASGTAPVLTSAGVDRLSLESNDGGTTWELTGLIKDLR